MAESYKRLGAVAPTDDKYTLLYTSPAATEALVSNITVTNRSASAQTFDVQVLESGVTQQSDLDVVNLDTTFVAVSFLASQGSTIAATSTDGITWTQRTLPVSAGWYSVTYGNGTFVAVSIATTGYAHAATSPDGITWTQRTLPVSASWKSVTYGNGTFVAVAYSSATAATSPDGITWTQRTLPVSAGWRTVTHGNGTFVAVARLNNIAASSTDGITWTQRTLPVANNWWGVTYGEEDLGYLPPTKTTLYKTSDIAANSTEILEPGIALAPEGAVVVKDNSGGNLTFSTYGVELS
jgi:hypothetical protein